MAKPRKPTAWELPPANEDWYRANPECSFPFVPRLLAVTDPHFPLHHVEVFRWLLRMVSTGRYDTMLWGGDQLDNGYKGHKNHRQARAASFDEGRFAFAQMLDLLTKAGITHHVIIPGNHDDKMWRDTDEELTFPEYMKVLLEPHLNHEVQLTYAHRYYATMAPGPDGWPSLFSHHVPFSKISGNSIRNMRPGYAFEGHWYGGHEHHLHASRDASGRFWNVNMGMGGNPKLMGYKVKRHTSHSSFCPGFVSVDWGVPTLHSIDNPREWWEARLASV